MLYQLSHVRAVPTGEPDQCVWNTSRPAATSSNRYPVACRRLNRVERGSTQQSREGRVQVEVGTLLAVRDDCRRPVQEGPDVLRAGLEDGLSVGRRERDHQELAAGTPRRPHVHVTLAHGGGEPRTQQVPG